MPDALAPAPALRRAPGGVVAAGLLALASLAVAIASLLLSFRTPFPAADPALAANLDRALAAAAAGIAFAVSASLGEANGRRGAAFEPSLFGIATGGAAGFVLGLKLAGGIVAAAALGLAGALLFLGAVRVLGSERRGVNLALLGVLAAALTAAVPTALAAATEGNAGSFALWLLGDVSHSAAGGTAAALAACLFVCGAAAVRIGTTPQNPAATEPLMIIALGLGIGIAGPIAFVGWFSALLARHAARELGAPARLLLSAAVGAALLMAADAVPRLLIGGYAPPLNVAIGVVAIPTFAWWNRERRRSIEGAGRSRLFDAFEATAIAAAAGGFGFVAWQIALYARSAT